MSDFEDDVRRTLNGRAHQAPDDASGLVEGARTRRRTRRRAVGGAVVAAALVAAVPVGLTLVNNDDEPASGQVADSPSGQPSQSADPSDDVTAAPDGWRWESWRNLEVMVPEDWRDGSAYDLCIPGHPSPPPGNVARDGYLADFEPDVDEQAVCDQGVTFLSGDPEEQITIPKGAVGERVTLGGNTIDVVAADQATLDEIVGSAREIEDTDSLGCAPRIEEGDGNYGEAEGDVVVCEYVVGGYGEDRKTPVLDSSSTMKPRHATEVRDILTTTTPVKNAAKVTYGCELAKGAQPYVVRRLQVGDVVLAELSTANCGSSQLVTGDGPQQVEYALLDVLDPATRGLN